VIDSGAAGEPAAVPEEPDIEAKLEGRQSPRGWGLFLIKEMVDETRVSTENGRHTLELVLHLDENGEGHE